MFQNTAGFEDRLLGCEIKMGYFLLCPVSLRLCVWTQKEEYLRSKYKAWTQWLFQPALG